MALHRIGTDLNSKKIRNKGSARTARSVVGPIARRKPAGNRQ